MKYINFKRYKFSTITKYISSKSYKFLKVFNSTVFKRYNYLTATIGTTFRKISFFKINKFVNKKKNYLFNKLKKIKFVEKKKTITYTFGIFIILIVAYLNIPAFYKFDKLSIEKKICENINIKCSIEGAIKYNFFPSPRLNIKNLVIYDFIDENKNLGISKNVTIKFALLNLENKEKIKIKKIELSNAMFNFTLNNFSKYRNFYEKEFYPEHISVKNSKIIFSDNSKNITTIDNLNFKYKFNKNSEEGVLKGFFLGDKIIFKYNKKKEEKNSNASFVLKFLNSKVLTKINLTSKDKKKNIISGDILLKKNKTRFRSVFTYKNNQIKFSQSDIRNSFLTGKVNGNLNFLPYFNFNLDVDLNGINLTKLSNFLSSLNKKQRKNLFKINHKINGKFNLTSDKIYSSYDIVKSFESKIQFLNGNIIVDQMLLNLGKLGAADIVGVVHNERKYSNFKFEKNIYIDNKKRLSSKLGIYNKEIIPSSLFVSGNLDLSNFNILFKEISHTKKFTDEDISFFEKEFNNILLDEGYRSLLSFVNLKKFIKLVLDESS